MPTRAPSADRPRRPSRSAAGHAMDVSRSWVATPPITTRRLRSPHRKRPTPLAEEVEAVAVTEAGRAVVEGSGGEPGGGPAGEPAVERVEGAEVGAEVE